MRVSPPLLSSVSPDADRPVIVPPMVYVFPPPPPPPPEPLLLPPPPQAVSIRAAIPQVAQRPVRKSIEGAIRMRPRRDTKFPAEYRGDADSATLKLRACEADRSAPDILRDHCRRVLQRPNGQAFNLLIFKRLSAWYGTCILLTINRFQTRDGFLQRPLRGPFSFLSGAFTDRPAGAPIIRQIRTQLVDS